MINDRTFFDYLPDELIAQISSYLPIDDKVNFSYTSRILQIVQGELLRKHEQLRSEITALFTAIDSTTWDEKEPIIKQLTQKVDNFRMNIFDLKRFKREFRDADFVIFVTRVAELNLSLQLRQESARAFHEMDIFTQHGNRLY